MDLLNLRTRQEIDNLLHSDRPQYSIIWVSDGCWSKSLSSQNYKLNRFRSIIMRSSFTPMIYVYGEKTQDNYWAAKSIENYARDYLKELRKDKEDVLVKECLS